MERGEAYVGERFTCTARVTDESGFPLKYDLGRWAWYNILRDTASVSADFLSPRSVHSLWPWRADRIGYNFTHESDYRFPSPGRYIVEYEFSDGKAFQTVFTVYPRPVPWWTRLFHFLIGATYEKRSTSAVVTNSNHNCVRNRSGLFYRRHVNRRNAVCASVG